MKTIPVIDISNPERDSTCKAKVLIVENLPVPFDRRVWMEVTAIN